MNWNPLNSIRGKLILNFLLFVVVPTLVIFFSYSYHSKSVIEQGIYATNQELVEKSADAMNDMAIRMVKATAFVESDFNQFNSADLPQWSSNYDAYSFMKQMQSKLTITRDLLLDSDAFLQVVDDRKVTISTLSNYNSQNAYVLLTGEKWYVEARKAKGYPFWSLSSHLNSELGYTYPGKIDSFVILSRVLYANDGSNLVAAVGVPNESFFGKQVMQEGGVPRLLIRTSDGRIKDTEGNAFELQVGEAFPENKDAATSSRSIMIHGNRYFVNRADVPQVELSLMYLMPYDLVMKQLDKTQNRSLIGILLVFLIGMVVFVVIMIRMTKPIYSLLRSMQQVGKGDFQTTVVLKGQDEIALLGRNFNQMVMRLQQLIVNLEEEQRNKEEARFQALQAQINPHFLFNTLNSIKLMAMLSGTNPNVSDMITALGKLLEFSMKQTEQYVTLRQELEYLELYMSLQKIRYLDNIQIQMNVPEEFMEMQVLKFSLQPLVENSLIHGGRFPLTVWINAAYTEDRVGMIVSVLDNGNGVKESELPRIMEQMTNDSNAKYSGIGVSNVDKRIKLHFGAAYGISLGILEHGGLQVNIRLPIRKVDCE
ncbi:sensor histidine kinase [Paenibacillus alba]|uniref:sensor histidine kinase n=1 Tax=Paenibacillus alba TaxID=1197127 RepID=UPI0015672118|nr:sensor histidine kinase [Paenibacillus alba]NQX71345.1 sensor histidine kinase [Paenibacillus alba]